MLRLEVLCTSLGVKFLHYHGSPCDVMCRVSAISNIIKVYSRVTIACGDNRGHMHSCHTASPGLCMNGHGWPSSRLLYRNCKSVCMMVKVTRQQVFVSDTVPTPASTGTGQSVYSPMSAQEHKHVCTVMYIWSMFLHFYIQSK